MKWQDIVFSVGGIIFSYGLIPQIYRIIKKKKADQFSWHLIVPTAVTLWVFDITYFTLGLWLSGIIGVLTSSCWTIICILKYKWRHNECNK